MICCIDLWDPLVGEVKLKQIGAILQYCIIQALYYVYLCICFFDICLFIHADWLYANTSNMSRESSKGRSSTGVKGGRDPAWTQASSLMKFINGWSFGLFSGVPPLVVSLRGESCSHLPFPLWGWRHLLDFTGWVGRGGWVMFGAGRGLVIQDEFWDGIWYEIYLSNVFQGDMGFIWYMLIWYIVYVLSRNVLWYRLIYHMIFFGWYSGSILYNPLSSLSYNKI